MRRGENFPFRHRNLDLYHAARPFVCPPHLAFLGHTVTDNLVHRALVQVGSVNRLELSERNELMSGDEQVEESKGVIRRTPF